MRSADALGLRGIVEEKNSQMQLLTGADLSASVMHVPLGTKELGAGRSRQSDTGNPRPSTAAANASSLGQ